jgi:predicted lipoprotein with Yx(FWY)xxD motif
VKVLKLLLIVALLAIAGCGNDEETPATGGQASNDAATEEQDATAEQNATAEQDDRAPAGSDDEGTTITIGDSEFGRMLFDSRKQAIYIFENDPKGKTVCYGECSEAWPPVFTDGKPKAGKGVRASLLGTVKRRDGQLHVTYAGKPLYFYVHEKPGEVRCHNVDLNGGFWWVVGPNGKRRA